MAIDVRESRRLLGPNLFWDRAGAGVDVFGPDRELDRFVRCWREETRRMLDALGWANEQLAVRRFPGRACLAISAPIDASRAASEVTREATRSTMDRLTGESALDRELRVERLARLIAQERNPTLRHLRGVAERQGVTFLLDEESVSVGLGRGSLTFPLGEVPEPEAIDWGPIHDVPSALITGTHGKTTVIRMLRAIAEAAELRAGSCTSEESLAGDEVVANGSLPGSEVHHQVLRNPLIDLAFLEVPRSRLCQRGLPIQHANVALITRVGTGVVPGENVVARALDDYGLLVLNAEQPPREIPDVPVGWFALNRDHLPRESAADSLLWLEGGEVRWSHDGLTETVLNVSRLPSALGGAARHNVLNAMGAILVASHLDISVPDIAKGLAAFGTKANPARCELSTLEDGVRVLMDGAADLAALEALADTAARLEAPRQLWVIGTPLPSREAERRTVLEWAARVPADRLSVVAEGGSLGSEELASENVSLGADPLALARDALKQARPGDLLVLTGDGEAILEYRELIGM